MNIRSSLDEISQTHSLERTSPLGGPFVGRCVQCGAEDLPGSAVHDECPNPGGVSQGDAILAAIDETDGRLA